MNRFGSAERRLVVADNCEMMVSAITSNLQAPSEGGQQNSVRMAYSFDGMVDAILEHNPHVVIFDDRLELDVPAVLVLEKAQRAIERAAIAPDVRWIVIGSHFKVQTVSNLVAAGCHGYIYRGDHLQLALRDAVNMVINNQIYLSPTAGAGHAELLRAKRSTVVGDDGLVVTETEMQLLRLLVDDQNTNQIQDAMDCSQEKVYRTRRSLKRKLGKQTNEGLIAAVCLQNIITLDMYPDGLSQHWDATDEDGLEDYSEEAVDSGS